MESPFKTPSNAPMFQMLASSGSTSPFTPKRSMIKKKNDREFNSVSRVLTFDDSNTNNNLPLNKDLEFLPLSQQVMLPIEYNHDKSEQTTPIKMKQPIYEKNTKILLSPSIKNHPNRFNITEQEVTTNTKFPSKRSNSEKLTPSKRIKSKIVENCKPITYFFKPIQKRQDSIINKISDDFQSTKHKLNEENYNIKIKTEFSINTDNNKLGVYDEIQISNKTSQNLNNQIINKNISPKKQIIEHIEPNKNNENINIHSSEQIKENVCFQNEKKKSPKKQIVKNLFSDTKSTKQLNISEQVTPKKNNCISNTHMIIRSPIIDLLENKVNISGGDTYSRFIKFIVLKAEIFFFGKKNMINTIENSTDDELKIFGRLISRKHGWIRYDGPDGFYKYKQLNIHTDFDSILMSLATKQLINRDVTSCELDCLLNILKSPELKQLQKLFNINLNNNKCNTKSIMINSFIKLMKGQTTFCGNSINNLKKHVKKILGDCIKISDNSRNDIMSCLIYESYPYFTGEEKDRFRDCFTKFSLVEKNELKFPTFKTQQVSLNFSSEENLETYKVALNLRQEVQLSLEQKNYENAIKILTIVFEKFKSAVCDKNIVESFFKIPTYMRKYSAISVYAHTLFKNISILKKATEQDLVKEVLEFLLKHRQFSMSKQADLHIELAKVLDSQYKQLNNAAKVILDGLKDNTMSELDLQMLSKRAVMYANRKIRKLDNDIKKELLNLATNMEKQLPSTSISGKIISIKEKGSSGRKQVYCKKTEDGDYLMSVEELALAHYKSRGFVNGIHDEGQLIKSMFLLCFWDIIYDSYPPHVLFIRQYQDCPLDWRTRHFYSIREHKIKDRILELKQLNVDQIYEIIKTRCDEFRDTQSVINWTFMKVDNLPRCKTLLECVGIEVFLAIGNQILKNGRIYLHGMPDLVVWNTVNRKCIFVEVKGPNDKLSERQYSWLLKLIEFGANVEVCHVVGTGGKNSNFENID